MTGITKFSLIEWFLNLFSAYRLLNGQLAAQESAVRELGSENARLRDDLLYWRTRAEDSETEVKRLLTARIEQLSPPPRQQHPAGLSGPALQPLPARARVRQLVQEQNRLAIAELRKRLEAAYESDPNFPPPIATARVSSDSIEHDQDNDNGNGIGNG